MVNQETIHQKKDCQKQAHQKQGRQQLCFLGLGSNLTNELGTPTEHIATAITQFIQHPNINNVQSSSLYVSEPYGVTDQPEFINAVVGLQTDMTPHELLAFCQSLETSAKRERLRHWGERSLDVDILLYGNEVVTTDDLTIPHVELMKRNFVLVPLAEVVDTLNINLSIQGIPLTEIAMSRDWQGLSKV